MRPAVSRRKRTSAPPSIHCSSWIAAATTRGITADREGRSSMFSSGHRLGRYEVIAPAGAGGMGQVYKARDTRLERIVAIKVLPAHIAWNPSLRERLEREAKAVASLSHPHICPIFDIGHQDGTDFLVMEFLE